MSLFDTARPPEHGPRCPCVVCYAPTERNMSDRESIITTGYGEGIEQTGRIIHKTGGILLALVLCLAGTVGAYAQGEVPLTPEHSCHMYDVNQSGQGFDLRIFPATDTEVARVFGTLYVGAIPQYYRYAPSWFTVQGGFEDGDGVSQTIPVGHVGGVTLGQPGLAYIIKYGDIRLTATGPDTIVGELRLDGGGDTNFSPNAPIVVTFNFRCLVR